MRDDFFVNRMAYGHLKVGSPRLAGARDKSLYLTCYRSLPVPKCFKKNQQRTTENNREMSYFVNRWSCTFIWTEPFVPRLLGSCASKRTWIFQDVAAWKTSSRRLPFTSRSISSISSSPSLSSRRR